MKDRSNEELKIEIVELEKLTKANQDLDEERLKLLWSLAVKRLQLLVQLPRDRGIINPDRIGKIAYGYRWLPRRVGRRKECVIHLNVYSGDGLYLEKRYGHDWSPKQRLWNIRKPNELAIPEGLTREEFLEWILELKIEEAAAWVKKKNQALKVEIEELAQREI